MLNLWLLLAQAAEKAGEGAEPTKTGQPGLGFDFLFLPLMLFAIFWLVVLRPGRRQEQERQMNLLKGLTKNDKVMTAAGIYGTIVAVSETEDEVTVKVDDNVRLRMTRASILRNITKEEAAKEAKDAAKNKKTGGGAPSA